MANVVPKRGQSVASWICVWIVILAAHAGSSNPSVVKLGVILPYDGTYPFSMPLTLSAIELAVESLQKERSMLPGQRIEVHVRDSNCSDGPLAAIDLVMKGDANVIFGPGCDYSLAPVSRFSPSWGIPLLTVGGLGNAFRDKTNYKLMTRIQSPNYKTGIFFINVCRYFNWKKIGLLYHKNSIESIKGRSNCVHTMEAISIAVKTFLGVSPWYKQFDEDDSNFELGSLLRNASKEARIIVLCASPKSVREIMLKAEELNFDNGEYVFINLDLFAGENQIKVPWHNEYDTNESNERAKKAYEALMTVTLRKPTSPAYRQFSDEVKRRAQEKYENFIHFDEEVNSIVGAYHDAVILYALALNETLRDNGTITDGAEITKRMWNRTFEGITGTVSIDAKGDRNGDYSLLDLNPNSQSFEVVANYYGNQKVYEPVIGKTIHWAGGLKDAPPDTPKCGFDGSLCHVEEDVGASFHYDPDDLKSAAISTTLPVTRQPQTTLTPVWSRSTDAVVVSHARKYYTTKTMQRNYASYWEDLSAQGTFLKTLSEGYRKAQTVKLKFAFPFYGHIVRNVTIVTGGFLYMSPFLHKFLSATQYIAPLMANFDTTVGNESNIRYLSTSEMLVVQWENVYLKDQVEYGKFNFQVQLKRTGQIYFLYKNVPVDVSKISEEYHPVKVGLSDAFYSDNDDKKLGGKKRTIYEYHRVTVNTTQLTNQTAVILEPTPTCNMASTCDSCLRLDEKLDCAWCEIVQRCSDGLDWYRQHWLDHSCNNLSDKDNCSTIPNVSTTKQVPMKRENTTQEASTPISTEYENTGDSDYIFPDPRCQTTKKLPITAQDVLNRQYEVLGQEENKIKLEMIKLKLEIEVLNKKLGISE